MIVAARMPLTDTAMYIGEAGYLMLDGTPLVPGVTVVLVPSGEAAASDLWEPVSPAAVPATALPLGIFDGGRPSDTNPAGSNDGGTP